MTHGTHATDSGSGAQYVLGHSEHELKRLIAQARLLEPMTERVLREGGLAAGMCVLDVGCGAGDVTFLVARMVGPGGQVVGVDRAPLVLATARRRAQEMGIPNARFVEADLGELAFAEPFDAVVGRYVLMHNPNPAALLHELAKHVRPGGVLAFLEADWTGYRSQPALPTWDQCAHWAIAALEGAGSDPYCGLKLYATFIAAGLPSPVLSVNAMVAAGPDHPLYTHAEDLMRTLQPALERLGIATASDLAVDTLAARLRDEAVRSSGAVVWLSLIGAAARKAAEQ